MLRASLGTVNINHCQRVQKPCLGNGLRGKSLRLVGRCPTNLAPEHQPPLRGSLSASERSTPLRNRDTCRSSIQVRARRNDQFTTQGVGCLLGSIRFKHSPADSDHHPLKHKSNELWIARERFASARQQPHDRLIEPPFHLLVTNIREQACFP